MLPKENVLLAGAPPVLLPKLNGAAVAVAVVPPFVEPPPNAKGVALDDTAGLFPIVLVPKEKPPADDLFPAAANRFPEVLLLFTVVVPPKLNVLFVLLLLAPVTEPNALLLLATFVLPLIALPPNIDFEVSLVLAAAPPKLNGVFAMLVPAADAVVAAPNMLVDDVLLALTAPALDAPKLKPPAEALFAPPVEDVGVDLLALLPPNAKGVVVAVAVVEPNAGFGVAALLTPPNVGVAPKVKAAG